jgi:NhaC family Na+:H+ antiporter
MKENKFLFSIITVIFLMFLIILSLYFDFPIFVAISGGSIPGIFFLYINKVPFNSLLKEIKLSFKSVSKIFILLVLIGLYLPLLGKSQALHTLIYTFTPLLENFPLTFSAFLSTLILSMLLGTAVGTLSILSPLFISTALLSSIPLPMVVGAMVSGAYFGDRTSYLSTSAHLSAAVSESTIHRTVPRMLKDSILPFLLSAVLFYIISPVPTVDSEILYNIKNVFDVEIWMLLPVAVLLLMIIFKVPVLKAIGTAVLSAFVISFFTRGDMSLNLILYGYKSPVDEYSYLLNTNGFINMISVLMVIASSALLNGVLKVSGLIKPLINPVLKKSVSPVSIIVNTALTSAVLTLITCNQTLTAIITGDNFKEIYDEHKIDKTFLASTIGNAGIGIVGIIPWNVNGLIVTALTDVPTTVYYKWSYFPILLLLYALFIQPHLYKKIIEKTKI